MLPGRLQGLRHRLRLRDRVLGAETPTVDARATATGDSTDTAGPIFTNPIAEGADPCVVQDGSRYLWCQSEGNVAVAVWESDRLTSLGRKHVVWSAPADGPFSKQVWAPELTKLDGRWYIYLAASDGDNATHLAYVLVADTDDPLGSYTIHGPLATGEGGHDETPNAWAIDMTVLEYEGDRYAVWSGWPDADTPAQHLYIKAMSSPVELTGRRVGLFSPDDYPWEKISDQPGAPGLNEAPQPLLHGGRTFVIYSCGSALLPSYKLGALELTGNDPLDQASWVKWSRPVFSSTETTFGVGHGGFVLSPDGSQWWNVYHAKISRRKNFKRAIHVQPMTWTSDGAPDLGSPVAAGMSLSEPAGTVHRPRRDAAGWDFGREPASVGEFDYYGHHQYFDDSSGGFDLGIEPSEPVNDYRSGEKGVLRDGDYGDLELLATFRFIRGKRAVGVLFRTTLPAVGYDAQCGYFAGIVPARGVLVLGKTDGRRWTLLGETGLDVDASAEHTLKVTVRGDHLDVVSGQARLERRDADHARGSVGLRVVDTHARFLTLRVAPLGDPEH